MLIMLVYTAVLTMLYDFTDVYILFAATSVRTEYKMKAAMMSGMLLIGLLAMAQGKHLQCLLLSLVY